MHVAEFIAKYMNLNWELLSFVTEYYNIIHIILYQNLLYQNIFIHIILYQNYHFSSWIMYNTIHRVHTNLKNFLIQKSG